MEFQLGDVVLTNRNNYFDYAFGVGGEKVGVVVDYEVENNRYRIYYSEEAPYIGTRAELISTYEGEISEVLMKKKEEVKSKL